MWFIHAICRLFFKKLFSKHIFQIFPYKSDFVVCFRNITTIITCGTHCWGHILPIPQTWAKKILKTQWHSKRRFYLCVQRPPWGRGAPGGGFCRCCCCGPCWLRKDERQTEQKSPWEKKNLLRVVTSKRVTGPGRGAGGEYRGAQEGER